MTTTRKQFPWLVPILIIACLFLVFLAVYINTQKSKAIMKADNLIIALQDTVKRERNEKGEMKATIAAFKVTHVQDLLKIQSKDSGIIALQNLVKQYKPNLKSNGSAANFTTETTIKSKGTTIIKHPDNNQLALDAGIPFDSSHLITLDSTIYSIYEFPIYEYAFTIDSNGKTWAAGNVIASNDSTEVAFKTFNEYDVVVGEKGLFKKETFADVISHSPLDSIKRLRAVNVTTPKKLGIGLGVYGGYGGTIINQNQQNTKPVYGMVFGWQIGIGFQWQVIRIK